MRCKSCGQALIEGFHYAMVIRPGSETPRGAETCKARVPNGCGCGGACWECREKATAARNWSPLYRNAERHVASLAPSPSLTAPDNHAEKEE